MERSQRNRSGFLTRGAPAAGVQAPGRRLQYLVSHSLLTKEYTVSNVIRFLETLGSNPALTRLSAAEYAATVAALDADHGQRQALLTRDHAALNDLLGGREKVLFAIFAPDDNEKQDDNQREQPIEETPPESE